MTVFTKDITNLVDIQYFETPIEDTGLYTSGLYTRYVNLAYGTANGLEIFFRKQQGERFRGQISYTLIEAKGSSFAIGDKENILQFGGIVEEGEHYLSWDQRHTIILQLGYHVQRDWSVDCVWRINSPRPYTLDLGRQSQAGKLISPNNRRLGWTNYLDVKGRRSFKLGPGQLALQLEAKNLLDSENLLWRDRDGLIGGVLSDPGAYDIGRRVSLGLIWSN